MQTAAEADKRFVANRKYNISRIWDVHHEIVRRLVLGQKAVDIAADLGVSEATVSYTRNSPIVKRQLEIAHGARDADVQVINAQVEKLAPIAVAKLHKILENDNMPQLQFKVAQEVLDRVSPKVHRYEGIQAKLTPEDIMRIKERAIKAAREAGMITDA